jgi:hypothetical protein
MVRKWFGRQRQLCYRRIPSHEVFVNKFGQHDGKGYISKGPLLERRLPQVYIGKTPGLFSLVFQCLSSAPGIRRDDTRF